MSLFQSGSSSRQIFKSALRFINFAAKFGNLHFKHESLRYFDPQWITIWDGAILLMHVYLLFLILGIRNCPNKLEFTRKFLKIVEKTVKNNKWKSLPFRSFKKCFDYLFSFVCCYRSITPQFGISLHTSQPHTD